jgi:pyruvate kinase
MPNKQTKIVATISDERCSQEFLRELHDCGVDVVRLNTAHQSFEQSEKIIKNVRAVSERIAILVDTKGPEIRTTHVDEPIELKIGDTIKIKGTASGKNSTRELVYVNYDKFVNDVPTGASILIDDGELELLVKQKRGGTLICEAVDNGVIKSNKSLNLPGVSLRLPSLSKKDKDYILFAIEQNLDFIAHSFVRNKQDVLAIQKILDKHHSEIKIIAKIENKEGVDNIDEILDVVYGVMVARGDLSIEIPTEDVPLIQKELIRKCIVKQKPIITATQMLHSMINNPRPTRAEVSDVANAIMDGTDAIMLSGETAYGQYPVQAVKMMTRIATATESKRQLPETLPLIKGANDLTNQLARSAVHTAVSMKAKEIIVSCNSGLTAELIAAYRSNAPIFIKCLDARRMRELALTYGINAHLVEPGHNQRLKQTLERLIKKEKIKKTDTIIYLGNNLDGEDNANFMEICEVEKYIKTNKS